VSARPVLRTEAPRAPSGSELHRFEAPLLGAGGLAFLLIRTLLLQGNLPLVPVLSIGFAALLFASIRDRGEPTTRIAHMSPVIPLVIGCVAVTFAAAAAEPRGATVSAAAAALTCLAAVSEEAFFRRFLYERLSGFGTPAAVAGSALLFAAIHVPAYGISAFPLDLGAGLLFAWQRWASGTWTVSAATHLLANLEVMYR
jgi:membrane protease YdiL (CAAX protease family)